MGDNMKAEELKVIVQVEEGIKHQGNLLEKLIQQQDRRFSQMFTFLTTIFIVLGTLMSVYQFLA